MTAKLAVAAIIAAMVIGVLLAAQMSTGSDPALGPKAEARVKKGSTTSGTGSSTATSSGSQLDPYSYGYGYGYSSGSSGSGYSGQPSSTPAPVTSGTS